MHCRRGCAHILRLSQRCRAVPLLSVYSMATAGCILAAAVESQSAFHVHVLWFDVFSWLRPRRRPVAPCPARVQRAVLPYMSVRRDREETR